MYRFAVAVVMMTLRHLSSLSLRFILSANAACKKEDPQLLRLLTSNKAFSARAEVFAGDAIMATAALDRLLHRCTVVNIRGESFRLKEKQQAARSTLAALTDSNLNPTPERLPDRDHKPRQAATSNEIPN